MLGELASTNSTTTGVTLSAVGGNLAVTGGTTTITNPTGIGLSIASAPAGATFNFGNTSVTGSGGTGVSPASNAGTVTFAALDITPDAGQRAFHATDNSGTLTATSGTISASNAPAVEITTASGTTPLAMVLTSVSGSGGATNITLTNVAGTLTMNGGALVGSTGRAVDISGGTATILYAGTVANDTLGVRVQNKTAGTVTFSGATKTLNTGANPAVTLTSNTGATIHFTNGGLDIDTTSGAWASAPPAAARSTSRPAPTRTRSTAARVPLSM